MKIASLDVFLSVQCNGVFVALSRRTYEPHVALSLQDIAAKYTTLNRQQNFIYCENKTCSW
jgi:hypothetical protein